MHDKLKDLKIETINAVMGTPFEHDLVDHARSLLNFLPFSTSAKQSSGTGTKTAKAGQKSTSRLNAPGSRLAFGRVLGTPSAVILLEKPNGPAAKEVNRLKSTLSGDVDLVTLGTPVSPKAEAGEDTPGAIIDDWRPGRSVGHVDGSAGTLGVFVQFKGRKGAGLQTLKGFTTASHVVTLNVTARNGSDILSPAPPDVNRDPGVYLAGSLRSWCRLVHYAESHAPAHGNATDIAFVEMDDPVNFPAANRVPAPLDPERKFLALNSVASPGDIDQFGPNTPVYKFGRTTGFTAGTLHSAMGPFTIKLVDGKSYLYSNLYLVQPKDSTTGFSAAGDSGAAVYTERGVLVGFVVGQASEGSLIQLAKPCLDFAKATLVTA